MAVIEKPEAMMDVINLTAAAAERIRSLLKERNVPDHALRVFVAGGGCSGLQYGMALEGQPKEYDTLIESDGVKVVVDPSSAMYLSGATIDYVDNLMGGGFRIDNPNAVASCGCGHSFRTTNSGATGGGCGHH